MAKGFIHTAFKDGAWFNEIEQSALLGLPHRTKAEAVAAGRKRARFDRTNHLIHNKNGTISERTFHDNGTG
jgi:Uncharacterized protein conserved in bacteria (DUF2188)